MGGLTLAQYVQLFSFPHVGIDFGARPVGMQLGGEAGLVLGAILSLAGGLWMFAGRSWGRKLVVAGVLLGIADQIVLLFPLTYDAWYYSENAIGTGELLLFAWVALACTPSEAGGTSPQQG